MADVISGAFASRVLATGDTDKVVAGRGASSRLHPSYNPSVLLHITHNQHRSIDISLGR